MSEMIVLKLREGKNDTGKNNWCRKEIVLELNFES